MERNFETVMIEQCAPVLAGLKACRDCSAMKRGDCSRPCPPRAQLERAAEPARASASASSRAVCGPTGILVYVYRESTPARDCAGPAAGPGFPVHGKATLCLSSQDARRAAHADPAVPPALLRRPIFPHEIGVFLGYPLYRCGGLYRELRAATSPAAAAGKPTVTPMPPSSHFAQLNKCTAVYLRLFRSGTPISSVWLLQPDALEF